MRMNRDGNTKINMRGLLPRRITMISVTAVLACCAFEALLFGRRTILCESYDSSETTHTAAEVEPTHPFTFCVETPSRCATLHQNRRFSFLHISKSGGASWILELRKLNLGSLFPTLEAGPEHGLLYHNRASGAFHHLYHHLTSLRSPRHHTWSLWAECRFNGWAKELTNGTDFPNTGATPEEDVRDFGVWINHFVSSGPNGARLNTKVMDYYNCYHPANYQTRAFISGDWNPHGPMGEDQLIPNVELANQTAFYFDFLAITEFFHESKCLLFYRVRPRTTEMEAYLDQTCHCQKEIASNWTDINYPHYQGRRRHTMLDLDARLLDKIAALTTTDTIIYRTALHQFMVEMSWLEASLNRRVVCNEVLDKWENELAYLNLSVTSLYQQQKKKRIIPAVR